MTELFNPGYLTERELKYEGFKSIGKNVKIAKNCTIVGLENISIDDNVRIDGYCSIIANGPDQLQIGSYVHIASYCQLTAGDGLIIGDFCGISHHVSIYSRTDDFSGRYLTGPTVPLEYLGRIYGRVVLKKHVVIGSGSVVLPNIVIEEGTSVGALSLVNKNLDKWGIYVGCPVRRLKDRSKKLLKFENKLLNS